MVENGKKSRGMRRRFRPAWASFLMAFIAMLSMVPIEVAEAVHAIGWDMQMALLDGCGVLLLIGLCLGIVGLFFHRGRWLAVTSIVLCLLLLSQLPALLDDENILIGLLGRGAM